MREFIYLKQLETNENAIYKFYFHFKSYFLISTVIASFYKIAYAYIMDH